MFFFFLTNGSCRQMFVNQCFTFFISPIVLRYRLSIGVNGVQDMEFFQNNSAIINLNLIELFNFVP